jgi:hypothetical protein
MLGGQIKVALLNTAQSTSVQYTTGPRPSHLGPCLSSQSHCPPSPCGRFFERSECYITLRKMYIGRI